MELEYKTVPFEMREITEEGIFEGYASIFGNVDSGGDVVDRGAFTKTLKESGSRVRICHQHDWHDLIGKPLELKEDRKGLFVKAQLVLDVQRAKEDYALMKAGALTDLSFGYDVVLAESVTVDGVKARHLKEVRLYEISPVTVAMNEAATITAVKELPPQEPELNEATTPVAPAAAAPDESPRTTQVPPSVKLELHRLSQKYLGGIT